MKVLVAAASKHGSTEEIAGAIAEVLGGRLERARLGFGEKAVVSALRAPDGDVRDWNEIRDWATVIADVLTS